MKKAYLDKLAAALQAYAPEETVLVASSRSEGRRMLSAVAAQGHILVGVRAETPASLARELCAVKLSEEGAPRLIESIEGAEFMRACMDESVGIFSSVNAKTLLATRAFYSTFQELALAEHTAEDLTEQPALQQLYTKYQEKKREKNLWDRSNLFCKALEEAAGEHPLKRAHFVVLGDYAPSVMERKLLKALSAPDRLTVVELPCAKDLSALDEAAPGQYLPMHAMGEQLPRTDALRTLKDGDSRFVACRGVETEVRFPLRDILDKNYRLEDCAIVCLSGSYLQPLYEEAARFHMPATIGGGLPLMGSRLYTTLKKVEALPNTDFDAEEVCALLENGSCQPEWAVKLSERIRRVKVGWSAERYELAWEYEEKESGKPKDYTTKQWKDLLADWQTFLTALLSVAQPEGDLEAQGKDLTALLEYCYREMSEAAAWTQAKALLEQVTALEDGETLLHRLLGLMETTSYLGGAAEPGSLYIAPLAQAACVNRKHLYIVGFSRYALQGIRKESPILLDKEREKLGGLKTSIEKGREQEFRLLTLLVRHEGDFVLTYPDFDSDGMLEQEPAPFFADAAGKTVEHVTYLPETAQLPADELLRQEWLSLEDPVGQMADDDAEPFELQPKKSRKEVLKEMVFSATALDTALRCPYAFYLQYVMHIRAPQVVERNDNQWLNPMDVGTFCHGVLEKYYLPDNNGDWEILFEEEYLKLKKEIPMPDPDLEESEKEKLHTVVERAIAWTETQCRKVLATEEDFLLPMTFGNWTIQMKGSIDRVDEMPDGSIAILDYKTGNPENYKNDMFRHWQHYLYTVAEEKAHSDRQVGRAGYLFLQEEAELVDMAEDDELREELEKRIAWLLDRISAEDYKPECAPGFVEKTEDPVTKLPPTETWELVPLWEGADGERCRYCEFTEICPVKRGGDWK